MVVAVHDEVGSGCVQVVDERLQVGQVEPAELKIGLCQTAITFLLLLAARSALSQSSWAEPAVQPPGTSWHSLSRLTTCQLLEGMS